MKTSIWLKLKWKCQINIIRRHFNRIQSSKTPSNNTKILEDQQRKVHTKEEINHNHFMRTPTTHNLILKINPSTIHMHNNCKEEGFYLSNSFKM